MMHSIIKALHPRWMLSFLERNLCVSRNESACYWFKSCTLSFACVFNRFICYVLAFTTRYVCSSHFIPKSQKDSCLLAGMLVSHFYALFAENLCCVTYDNIHLKCTHNTIRFMRSRLLCHFSLSHSHCHLLFHDIQTVCFDYLTIITRYADIYFYYTYTHFMSTLPSDIQIQLIRRYDSMYQVPTVSSHIIF